MKLDRSALAYASAALCGGAVLIIGLANLAAPSYGRDALYLLESLAPGYHGDRSVSGVLVATGYALCYGAALGWLFGWFYNRLRK